MYRLIDWIIERFFQTIRLQNTLPDGCAGIFEMSLAPVSWDQFPFHRNQRRTCRCLGYTVLHHTFIERCRSVHYHRFNWYWLDVHQAHLGWQGQEIVHDCYPTSGSNFFYKKIKCVFSGLKLEISCWLLYAGTGKCRRNYNWGKWRGWHRAQNVARHFYSRGPAVLRCYYVSGCMEHQALARSRAHWRQGSHQFAKA